MDKKIVINKDLKFDFDDLPLEVDTEQDFTLMDVINACMNSKIPMPILGQMINCNYIPDYCKEANSQPFTPNDYGEDEQIEYLELSLYLYNEQYKGKKTSSHYWSFNGMGFPGVISKDIKEYSGAEKVQKMIDEGWRESYAIEFSPIYKLCGFKIKIAEEYSLEKSNLDDFDDKDQKYTTFNYKPAITLYDLIYWIFWELSFCGGIKDREEKNLELKDRIDEIDQWKKDGTLDQHMIPWEKVKIELEGKFGGKKDENNKVSTPYCL